MISWCLPSRQTFHQKNCHDDFLPFSEVGHNKEHLIATLSSCLDSIIYLGGSSLPYAPFHRSTHSLNVLRSSKSLLPRSVPLPHICSTSSIAMQLRRSVTVPTRYEDEDVGLSRSHNGTKPAYPAMLKEQVVPFNPDNPPAAFPSLPLSATRSGGCLVNDPEELSEVSPSMNSLSGRGLGITFPPERGLPEDGQLGLHGAGVDEHESSVIKIDHRALTRPASTGDERQTIEASQGESILSTDTNLSPNALQTQASWDSLPLSLQYRIYKALSEEYPAKSLSTLLGLTDHESTKILKAVGLRSLHPASVTEIWNYCRDSSEGFPGAVEPQPCIDPVLFDKYVSYMVFASNYEFAYESELRRAEEFLASRGIPKELLETWLPDPSYPDGSAFLIHVPGMTGQPTVLTGNTIFDSGYSSFSEADSTQSGGRVGEAVTRGRANLPFELSTSNNSVSRQRVEQQVPIDPALLNKRPRHPLGIVISKSKMPSPRDERGNPQHTHEEYLPESSWTMGSDKPRAPKETERNGLKQWEKRSAGSMNLRARSSLKGTAALTLSREEEDSWRAQDGDKPQRETNSVLVPNPRRLVLKIQDKDGLARIFKKKSKSVHSTKLSTSPEATNEATGYVSVSPGKYDARAPLTLPLNTKITSFNRGLLLTEAPELDLNGTGDETFPPGATSLSKKNCECPQAGGPTALISAKRKASQSDIRPYPPKSQRNVADTTFDPAASAIASDNMEGAHRYRTGEKSYQQPATSSFQASSEANAPTKCSHMTTGMVAPKNADGYRKDAVERESSKVVKSPSYSPISENETLEEFQALLHGPVVSRLRTKIPHSKDEAPTKTSPLFTPFSLLNGGFPNHLSVTAPAPDGHVKRSQESNVSETPAIKLIFKNMKAVSQKEHTASPAPPVENTRATSPQASEENQDKTTNSPSKAQKENTPAADVVPEENKAASTSQNMAKEVVSPIKKGLTPNIKEPSVATALSQKTTLTNTKATKASILSTEKVSTPAIPKAQPVTLLAQPEKATQGQPKSSTPTNKRGPRGPYRKTRERQEREERERLENRLKGEKMTQADVAPEADVEDGKGESEGAESESANDTVLTPTPAPVPGTLKKWQK